MGSIQGGTSLQRQIVTANNLCCKRTDNKLTGLASYYLLKFGIQSRYTTTVADYKSLVEECFPKVLRGLGNLGDPYVIKLTQDAIPHAIYTPRTVALPMRSRVQEELDQMKSIGVIS